MSAPTFSIYLCNYNHAKYLPQCLAGMLRQSFTDFEVVITDDGSTDGSQRIIAGIAAKDSRLKTHFFTKNQGLMAATKNALERVTGTYIFGEGADDFIFNEHFLALAATALAEHPTAAGFFGVVGLLDAEQNQVTGKFGSASREGYIPPEDCYRDFLRGNMFAPGSSSIWRRDCMQEIGGFDFSLGPQIDFLMNHALPARHGVVFTSAPVTCQRIYQKASSFGSKGGTLWEATGRLAKVEARIREWGQPYTGMEEDWKRWRAQWAIDAIKTSGIRIE